MPRVLIVTAHFPPATAVGGRRPARFARLLPRHGYDVDVICATPIESGAENEHPTPADPSQREYVPDERRVLRIEPDLKFGRDPFNRPSRSSLAPWMANKVLAYFDKYVLTHDWSWRWGEKVARRIHRDGSLSAYDLLLVDIPPLPAVVPVLRLAREAGIPIVSDFRDLWMPHQGLPLWARASPSGRRQLWWSGLSTEVVQASASVVLTTTEACDVARSAFPALRPSHFRCVTNAFDNADSDQDAAARTPDILRLLYTGSLAYGRDCLVERVIRAMGVLKSRGQLVELTLAGSQSGALNILAEREGVHELVRQVGWIDRDKAVQMQREAGALLLLQPPNAPGTSEAIPAKLFEYMERRRHILSLSTPAADDIIEKHRLGVVASTLSHRELADALCRLEARVRAVPVLPPPPREFSDEHTVAAFARILDQALADRAHTE